MSQISDRLRGLVQSDIRRMSRECERVGGINLGQGICDLPTIPGIVAIGRPKCGNTGRRLQRHLHEGAKAFVLSPIVERRDDGFVRQLCLESESLSPRRDPRSGSARPRSLPRLSETACLTAYSATTRP